MELYEFTREIDNILDDMEQGSGIELEGDEYIFELCDSSELLEDLKERIAEKFYIDQYSIDENMSLEDVCNLI